MPTAASRAAAHHQANSMAVQTVGSPGDHSARSADFVRWAASPQCVDLAAVRVQERVSAQAGRRPLPALWPTLARVLELGTAEDRGDVVVPRIGRVHGKSPCHRGHSTRKRDGITRQGLALEIEDGEDIATACSTCSACSTCGLIHFRVPPVDGQNLSLLVDGHVHTSTEKPPARFQQVPPEFDEVLVQLEGARVRQLVQPVRGLVGSEGLLESEVLALEDHGNAGAQQSQRRAQSRQPAANPAVPPCDGQRQAEAAGLVVALRVDHPPQAFASAQHRLPKLRHAAPMVRPLQLVQHRPVELPVPLRVEAQAVSPGERAVGLQVLCNQQLPGELGAHSLAQLLQEALPLRVEGGQASVDHRASPEPDEADAIHSQAIAVHRVQPE
mmetsp:Transcript_22168/g.52717  ORF Transcript_22168/g.52717 Transcript_22168/m.52717 type:complete len:385 (+) Transcript_22168:508-1662(+)